MPLVNNQIYHVVTRSIAGFTVFNSADDYARIKLAVYYYSFEDCPNRFSHHYLKDRTNIATIRNDLADKKKLVEIIAYCIMPTHVHLVLRQAADRGISDYMQRIFISYAKYFNTKYNRKGPLLEGRFKSILVDDTEQLLHLTRYVHLNPSTAYLVNYPEDWEMSSYREFIGAEHDPICAFADLLQINTERYRKFVEDRKDYQRKLAGLKRLTLDEDYSNHHRPHFGSVQTRNGSG
jgi:putative transposase